MMEKRNQPLGKAQSIIAANVWIQICVTDKKGDDSLRAFVDERA